MNLDKYWGSHDLEDLFPVEPFAVHSPPKEITVQEITEQKQQNYARMISLAQDFLVPSKILVEKAAFLAMQHHFNHYRGGLGHPHYSIHLLEVANRVSMNFDSFPIIQDRIQDKDRNSLDAKAVAITLALLHDSIEDFFENFVRSNRSLSKGDAQLAAESHLRQELAKLGRGRSS